MNSSKFYNAFSVFYPLVDIFLKKQKLTLTSIINNLPAGSVLEIGVGNGSHLNYYKNHQLTAIDISSAMLANARKIAPTITLIEMNGEELKFADQSFNYIVISHTIAVAKHPDRMIAESYRALKPNGKLFILNHFTPKNWFRFIDYSFQPFSKILHFKSVFHVRSIPGLEIFNLEDEISLGKFAYFKLLILSKS